jgi:ApaG protein
MKVPVAAQHPRAALTRALYRALLEVGRSAEYPLRIRLPLHQSLVQWPPTAQQHAFVPARSAAQELFPGLAKGGEADAPELEANTLRSIIRSEFRRLVDGQDQQTAAANSALVDIGLNALKALNLQLDLAKRTSVVRSELPATGAAVIVEASSVYRGREGPFYVFAYRLRLRNVGDVPVQVIGRSWDIRNADGSQQAKVPRGSPGIVGQMPTLQPGGDAFEYASGTTLKTPAGAVQGSLQIMSLGDGVEPSPFDAEVGRFLCISGEES